MKFLAWCTCFYSKNARFCSDIHKNVLNCIWFGLTTPRLVILNENKPIHMVWLAFWHVWNSKMTYSIWKVGNHGNPTLVAIQYTHRHTHYIDSKFLYNIHTNNWPQCFNFTYFMDFLLKINHFLLTGCYGKMQKIVRFKFFNFNFRKSFNPKLHLHITKMTCPCAGFQSKSIFKRCYKH